MNKQLEKKRKLEEEALQKVNVTEYDPQSLKSCRTGLIKCYSWRYLTQLRVFSCFGQAEEAQEQYQSCVADAGIRKMDLANTKSTILTQIRKMVFQCDLTLKAVSC